MRSISWPLLTALGFLVGSAAAGADWTSFRGPHGRGVSPDPAPPVRWGEGENVLWKTRLPGPGASGPVVLGGRVFVTCYTGYGTGKGGTTADLRRHLLCLDRRDGSIRWQADVPARLPESTYGRFIGEHGYASGTPATDGDRVYVYFGRTGALAFDLDGKQLWHTELGTALNGWGSASSPVLHNDLLLINASVEGNALVALDRRSGRVAWRAKGVGDCWSTPVVVDVPGGKTEVVLHAPDTLLGFDPDTGARLWECPGVGSATASSTPVARDGVVYVMAVATGGARSIQAVRAGGRGDVSQTHVVWRQKAGANHCSPVLVGDFLYWVSGLAWCLRADTGEIVYRERLYDGRDEYPSAVAAGGKLFAVTRRDGAFVLAADGRFALLSRNDLGDRSVFNASPALSDGQLFLRSDEAIYCIGRTK